MVISPDIPGLGASSVITVSLLKSSGILAQSVTNYSSILSKASKIVRPGKAFNYVKQQSSQKTYAPMGRGRMQPKYSVEEWR